jgi:hypothetical protein
MHDGKKEKKNEKLFIGRGSVGTMVKSSLKKRAEKTISHLFVFQQLQNHKFLHCHEEICWNTVGYSKINTLNGVSNKTFQLLMEISFLFNNSITVRLRD